MKKFKVSQKVWVSFSSMRTDKIPDREDVVIKAGTKNVRLKDTSTIFNQEDGIGQGNYKDRLFHSKKALDDYNEKRRLSFEVSHFFDKWNKQERLSLEELRLIHQIIQKYQ